MPRSFGPVGRLLAVRARKHANFPLRASFPGAVFWRSARTPRIGDVSIRNRAARLHLAVRNAANETPALSHRTDAAHVDVLVEKVVDGGGECNGVLNGCNSRKLVVNNFVIL